MNTLRRLSAATILSLTLAISVFGGHIETPGFAAQRPPSTSTTSTTDVTTDIVLTVVSTIYP